MLVRIEYLVAGSHDGEICPGSAESYSPECEPSVIGRPTIEPVSFISDSDRQSNHCGRSRHFRGVSARRTFPQKWGLAILAAVFFNTLFLVPDFALAQGQTGSATLTVTANLLGSISMTFVTDASGVTLTNSGTNTATLAFGDVSASTAPPTHVTETVAATTFTVSTPFDIAVTKSNVTSANYALTAEMQTTDAVNAWKIDTFPLTTVPAAATSLTVTGVYATNVAHTLFLTIPFTEGAILISNTINFVATAN